MTICTVQFSDMKKISLDFCVAIAIELEFLSVLNFKFLAFFGYSNCTLMVILDIFVVLLSSAAVIIRLPKLRHTRFTTSVLIQFGWSEYYGMLGLSYLPL